MKSSKEFEKIIEICRDIFEKKSHDYGTSWRVLRPTSLTDQIFIKAERIRSFEIKKVQKINESIFDEYIAMVNYSAIALIQIELGFSENLNLSRKKVLELYDKYLEYAKNLMCKKNHDYNEAWRKMRITSYTDFILMKIHRTKQIENQGGKTIISEGVDANYYDIINYSIFALIKLKFYES